MAASVSSLYRRSADTFAVSSFIHSHFTHLGALIVRRAIYALIRTASRHRIGTSRGREVALPSRFLNNVARNSLFGSALRAQKPHDFNTSPSNTEERLRELRAKFRGPGISATKIKTEAGQGQNQDEARNRARPGRAACDEAGAGAMQRGRGRAHARRGQGQTCARSVTSASVSSTRSRGLSSTLRPRRPPETIMVSWSRQEESMNRRCAVVCPSGLMPPTT